LESVVAKSILKSEAIARALHGAFCRGASSEELFELAATKMHAAGPPYDSVYIFSVSPTGDLQLKAESGNPTNPDMFESAAGVRDQAMIEKANQYLPRVGRSVHGGPESKATGSVLAVLIRRHDEILGAIQIESELPVFSDLEQTAVERVAGALAVLL
jgi:hypothetical protein